MVMRCPECGCKIKKQPKRVCTEKFGNSDIDHLAMAMYKEFHKGSDFGKGWDEYQPYTCDNVVRYFRHAAKIAAEIVEDRDTELD